MDRLTKAQFREYIESILQNCQRIADSTSDPKVLIATQQLQFKAMCELYRLDKEDSACQE